MKKWILGIVAFVLILPVLMLSIIALWQGAANRRVDLIKAFWLATCRKAVLAKENYQEVVRDSNQHVGSVEVDTNHKVWITDKEKPSRIIGYSQVVVLLRVDSRDRVSSYEVTDTDVDQM